MPGLISEAAIAAFVVLASIPGCKPETRYRVLSVVFDDVPPPGAPSPQRHPVRQRRMVTVAPPPTLPPPPLVEPVDAGPVIEAASKRGFDATIEVVPKDALGNPDWVAAFDQGLMAPRPAIDPEAPVPGAFDLNIDLDPGIPNMKVVFPHRAHTLILQCPNCHPEIFPMKAGATKITMGGIFAGKWCGHCHGKVAFDLANCQRCHTQLGG